MLGDSSRFMRDSTSMVRSAAMVTAQVMTRSGVLGHQEEEEEAVEGAIVTMFRQKSFAQRFGAICLR